MSLQKKDVFTAITAIQVQLSRVLLRSEHGKHLSKLRDSDDWLITLEGAWHRDLQVLLR